MKKNDDFQSRFKQIILDSEKHCYITRDIKVQKEAINQLEKIKKEILILKKQAIQRIDEQDANLLLSMECMITALISELKMYLYLKDGKPSDAWFCLIDAQDWTNASIRAFKIPEFSQDGYARKLFYVEKIIFPPQTFTSPSMLIGRSECSICKTDYGNCGHIAGEPYKGTFCTETVTEIKEFFHLAIVSHPVDKRRIMINFSEGKNGLVRDYMTWNLQTDKTIAELQQSDNKTKNTDVKTNVKK